MKKKSQKFFLSGFALMIMTAVYILVTDVNPEDIKTVCYLQGGSLYCADYYYTIDFEKNIVTREVRPGNTGNSKYEKEKENNTACMSKELTNDMKERLVKSANMYGVPRWFKRYTSFRDSSDSPYDSITIELKNGKTKEIYCEMRYPVTFKKMEDEFFDIIGDF